MLDILIINTFDFINITILWTFIMNEEKNHYKFIFSVLCASVCNTLCDYLMYNFILFYVFTIIIYKAIYKHTFLDTIFIFLVSVSIDMILQLIISFLIVFISANYIQTAILVEFIIFIILIILRKFVFTQNKFNVTDFNLKINSYIISIFSVYIIYLKNLWQYDHDLILNNILVSIIGISILFLSQIAIYFKIVRFVKEEENLKCSNDYNKVIDDIIMEIRGKQHDFINYKNAIKGLVEVLDPDDIKREIIKYMNEEDKENYNIDNLIYINNPVVRAIIYKFICKVNSLDIKFDYKIENDVIDNTLNYIEITNILSNLLNNAFDEVIREDCLSKHIEVKLFNYYDEQHIILINSIVPNNTIKINKLFQKGYSSKQRNYRGYGLYNIKKIVDLHNGKINLELNNVEFKIDIYFNSSGKSGSP